MTCCAPQSGLLRRPSRQVGTDIGRGGSCETYSCEKTANMSDCIKKYCAICVCCFGYFVQSSALPFLAFVNMRCPSTERVG